MLRNNFLIFLMSLGLLFNSNAQVGIGNTNPQSTLDIATDNMNAPSNTDGILVPRVNTFPTTDPTSHQNGMMVFLAKDIPGYFIGFHYWDHPKTQWIPIGAEEWKDGVNASGDNLIFATQAKVSGTDVVITDDGRIGFGTSDPIERFEFKGPGDNDFQITSANPNPPNVILYNTGGTLDTPAALATNGEIGSFIVKTHDGDRVVETGGFRFFMDGVATPGSAPSRFVINTTPSGSIFQQARIVVRSNGNTGIGTEEPSERLDVAGNLRVRNITSGPLYADSHGVISNTPVGPVTVAAGLIEGNGNALKIYGATVSRISKGNYQVTFTTARSSSNYIINLTSADCNDAGDCDFDDPGITYLNRQASGFQVNIGDSDNGGTAKEDIDLEFTFSVIDF